LLERGVLPDEVIISSARRCIETWDGLRKAAGIDVAVRTEASLYHASADKMLQILQTARLKTVLMIGHNPGIGQFASMMPEDSWDLYRRNNWYSDRFWRYPTGATITIEFAIDSWTDAEPLTGNPVDYFDPRTLKCRNR